MSVEKGVYDRLCSRSSLTELLSTEPEAGLPAIYTTWGERGRSKPYVVLRSEFISQADQIAKMVRLTADIFTAGQSSAPAKRIAREIIEELILTDPVAAEEAGDPGVRFLLGSDGEAPTDSPEEIHWTVELIGRFGAKQFADQLS